jgi:hypothetical protein
MQISSFRPFSIAHSAGVFAAGLTSRLYINTTGNVGIGTTSPSGRLTVQGAGTTTGETLKLQNSAGTDIFKVLDNGTTTLKGNVGIGTGSPTSKLQVVGLPTYADNTAALAGGLTAGAFYRTSTGVLMVTY